MNIVESWKATQEKINEAVYQSKTGPCDDGILRDIQTSFMDYVDFEDLIIEDVELLDDELYLHFERLSAYFNTDYEVYDLRDSDMGRLREGDAVLYFISNTTTYFIVIW
jgi:hypothetical protein